MHNLEPGLAGCSLFHGIPEEELAALLEKVSLTRRAYARDQVVAIEGDECTSIGIITAGSMRVERIFPSGKLVLIDLLSTGSSFGEAVLFSSADSYPATLTAAEPCEVIFISRAGVELLCARSARFLDNFLGLLSDKILLLNRKIKTLSFQSVRQKVANYLLEESGRQGSSVLTLSFSRREMADLLGIPRPSLSRELAAMQAEGWIEFDRNQIRLVDPARLETSLSE